MFYNWKHSYYLLFSMKKKDPNVLLETIYKAMIACQSNRCLYTVTSIIMNIHDATSTIMNIHDSEQPSGADFHQRVSDNNFKMFLYSSL